MKIGPIKPPIPYDPWSICIQKFTFPDLCVYATHTFTIMFIIDENVAIKNIIIPCTIKSRKNVNNAIVMKTKIDANNIMEWNFINLYNALSKSAPAKNPADLQKNK